MRRCSLFLLSRLSGGSDALAHPPMPWVKGKVLVERLASEAGIRRPVAIFLHEDIATPVTCGFVRPAIVLPLDAQQWSEDDARHALLHELEHVHRADWPVQVMARVVCALYWFHPFVWMAWRRLRLESERACDDAVLRVADPAAYADQLVMLAQRLSAGGPRPLLSMANRSDLSVRVSAVLDANQPRGRSGIGYSATTVCVAVVVLLAISAVGVVGESRRDPNAATAQAQPQAPATGTGFVFISVKANRSGDRRYYPLELGPDGRFVATNTPLDMLFRSAYQGLRIEGRPSWFNSERFDIEAHAEGNPTRAQMWMMVRKLLADRFSLITHTETRIVPVYALVMAATDGTPGPQLRLSSCIGKDTLPPGPLDPSREPPLPCGGIRIRTGSLQARWQTMEELASGLALMTGRNVLNQTGLTGKFDLEVEWTPAPGPPGPAGALGVGPATLTAIEERLGLRLEPQTGPVDYLVIDRVERPTEDP